LLQGEGSSGKASSEDGEDDGGVVKTLPRAQLLVHGGDLAYPNPTGAAGLEYSRVKLTSELSLTGPGILDLRVTCVQF
jgi:hypothetical protein